MINTDIGNNLGDMNFYHLLRDRGLTPSMRHFSREWLGAAENYASLRAGRFLSPRVMVHLFRALWSRGHYILAARVGWATLWH